MKKILVLIFIFTLPLSMMVQAQFGNCLDFDGIDDYVDCGGGTTFKFSDNFSVEAWICARAWGNHIYSNVIIGKSNANGYNGGYALTCGDNGRVSFAVSTNASWQGAESTNILELNVWYHLAATVSGGFIKLYVDGNVVATKDYVGLATKSSDDRLCIGVDYVYTSNEKRFFNGKIDEVAIWNKGLSKAEINAQIESQSNDSSSPNLLGYYNFNQGVANGDNTSIEELVDSKGLNNGSLGEYIWFFWLSRFGIEGNTSNFVPAEHKEKDYDALMALYNSTNGTNWTQKTNWGSSQLLKYWSGVQADSRRRLEVLNLDNNNLVGTIPAGFISLDSLTTLVLADNQMTGQIPSTIKSLSHLQSVDISNNQFSGSLPPEIGCLNRLTDLNLSNNLFSGDLPVQIYTFSALEKLDLSNNQITGSIAKEIKQLSNLQYLYLSDNQLVSIDEASTELTNLKEIDVSNNELTSLPIFNKTKIFNELNVQNNHLTPWILEQNYGKARKYNYAPQQVDLGRNITLHKFEKEGHLKLNVRLDGDYNSYQWTKNGISLPNTTNSSLDIATLEFSDAGVYACTITNTKLSGLEYQSPNTTLIVDSLFYPVNVNDSLALVDLYNATNSNNWYRKDNWLKNDIRFWYGVSLERDFFKKESRVVGIHLNGNGLQGSLPQSLQSLSQLSQLNLSSNAIEQSLTDVLGILKNLPLSVLNLASNDINGTITSDFSQLLNLSSLNLSSNRINGILPSDIGNYFPLLKELYLNDNSLEGEIPVSIEAFTKLENLTLSNNLFTGTFPSCTNLKNLNTLKINNNLLDELPNLSTLTALKLLMVNANYFSFSDLSPNVRTGDFQYIYSPQIWSSQNQNLSFYTGSKHILSVTKVDADPNNVYSWYHNGSKISSATSCTLDYVSDSDKGVYTWNVTNSALPNLQVQSTINVQVLSDSLVLVALYQSTNGKNWTNNKGWLNTPFDQWQGLTFLNGRVASITLENNNLQGMLPAQLGELSNLTSLDISSNQLSGSFPPEVQNLSNLQFLYLAHNKFSALPQQITQLSNLRYLDISYNELNTIPVFYSFSTFDYLDVQSNHLNPSILEQNLGKARKFNYAPQDALIGTEQTFNKKEGEEIVLAFTIEGQNNCYQWKKDGKDISCTSTILSLNPLSINDNGMYYCVITNSSLSGLQYQLANITLNVSADLPKPVLSSQPTPYCFGDGMVLLSTQSYASLGSLVWYSDANCQNKIATGESLVYDMKTQSISSLYVRVEKSSYFGEALEVLLYFRPELSYQNGFLTTRTLTGNYTYEWFFNGVKQNALSTNQMQSLGDGIYQVRITTNEGCRASSLYYQISANKMYLTDIQENAFENTSLELYPNPINERLNLRINGNWKGEMNVQLFDMIGKKVFAQTFSNANELITMNLANLSKGVYIVKVNNESNTLNLSQRIVKVK